MVRHGDHTHLTYELELPSEPGAVQEELNVRLDAEAEDADSAEIFRRLHMPRDKHPTEPLAKGEWR
ncbi:hypothetical protein ACH47Z_06605 [Streptomyces sp. NPDC020192]|uniref:hypothetical protein n=1 Tax=Streptomyces sp. NPDC020192 TaxID=3365066 RepID=UPI0037A77F83